MPNPEGLRRPFGFFLLAVLVLGIGLWLANQYVEDNRPHDVIGLTQVNDSASVSVNCFPVVPGRDGEVFDLGYLRPDDRVYIAVYNGSGGASWAYTFEKNGEVARSDQRLGAGPGGYPAGRGMVLEKAFTATGHPLGNEGCDGPRLVTPEVPNYQLSPDVGKVPVIDGKEQHWSAREWPYGPIHALGAQALVALAILGGAVAVLWRPLREQIRNIPGTVLLGTLTLGAAIEVGIGLLPSLGWGGSWLVLRLIGIGLLAWAAKLALAPHTESR